MVIVWRAIVLTVMEWIVVVWMVMVVQMMVAGTERHILSERCIV